MNEKIKITIELSPEEYGPIEKMAEYCACPPARIIEALIQGHAQYNYLDQEGDLNWRDVTEYLRETEGYSPRLGQIEEYLLECADYNKLRSFAERDAASYAGQLDSLEAFLAWKEKEARSHSQILPWEF